MIAAGHRAGDIPGYTRRQIGLYLESHRAVEAERQAGFIAAVNAAVWGDAQRAVERLLGMGSE